MRTKQAVAFLAKQLLYKNELFWSVGDIDDRTSYAHENDDVRTGAFCDDGAKQIWLPLGKMRRWSLAKQRDLILHEIAHALVPEHNHDETWVETALRIGMRKSTIAEHLITAGLGGRY